MLRERGEGESLGVVEGRLFVVNKMQVKLLFLHLIFVQTFVEPIKHQLVMEKIHVLTVLYIIISIEVLLMFVLLVRVQPC